MSEHASGRNPLGTTPGAAAPGATAPATASNAATVHVIDDDPGMRNSIKMVLESASLPVRVHESAEDFLDDIDPRHAGCIVLDLRMPGMGGMALLQKLKDLHSHMPVIIISGHADVTTAVRGMKLGAIDLLQKPFEPQALLALVRGALQTSADSQRRAGDQAAIHRRLSTLTARELELLKLVVGGNSNKQIASRLGISIKTVANHRAHLMTKTQALNAADLARLSTIAGITPEASTGTGSAATDSAATDKG